MPLYPRVPAYKTMGQTVNLLGPILERYVVSHVDSTRRVPVSANQQILVSLAVRPGLQRIDNCRHPNMPGKCLNVVAGYIWNACLALALDIHVLIIPARLLLQLKFSIPKRLSLIGVFCLSYG